MLSLMNLKDEYRETFAGDDYGHCKEWWFTIAEELYWHRGMDLPVEWGFVPSPLGNQNDKDSIITHYVEVANTWTLLRFGKILFRLAQYMREKGLD